MAQDRCAIEADVKMMKISKSFTHDTTKLRTIRLMLSKVHIRTLRALIYVYIDNVKVKMTKQSIINKLVDINADCLDTLDKFMTIYDFGDI